MSLTSHGKLQQLTAGIAAFFKLNKIKNIWVTLVHTKGTY